MSVYPKENPPRRRHNRIAGRRSVPDATAQPSSHHGFRLQSAITLAAGVATLIALILSWFAFRQDQTAVEQGREAVRQGQEASRQEQAAQARATSAELLLAGDPTIRTTSEVRAQSLDGTDPSWSEDASVDASAIDVLLQNTGGRPALITSVEATITRVVILSACASIGGTVYTSALPIGLLVG
jgi:hypothetical protein